MRFLWITALAMMLNACAINPSDSKFVSSPVPDEIRVIIYSAATSGGTRTWRLNNDDLTVRLITKLSNGKVVADRSKKSAANDFNWIIYSLEEANFTQVKSLSRRRASQANEVLTIITQDGSHSYTQNSSTQFPKGFQKIISVILERYSPRVNQLL